MQRRNLAIFISCLISNAHIYWVLHTRARIRNLPSSVDDIAHSFDEIFKLEKIIDEFLSSSDYVSFYLSYRYRD